MVELVKVNNVYNTVVNFYEADTNTDKASIDTSVIGIGSTVHVIETDTTYMLNGSKQWVEISKGGGSGGGGGSALPAVSTADYGKFLGVNSSGEWDPTFGCEVVYFYTDNEDNWQADKTFDRIIEALSATKLVVGMDPQGHYLIPTVIDQYEILFTNTIIGDSDVYSTRFNISDDNSVYYNQSEIYGADDENWTIITFSSDTTATLTSAITEAITDCLTNNMNGYGWADIYSEEDNDLINGIINDTLDTNISPVIILNETSKINIPNYGYDNEANSCYLNFIIPAYEFNNITFRLTVTVNSSDDGYYHIQFTVIAEQLYTRIDSIA